MTASLSAGPATLTFDPAAGGQIVFHPPLQGPASVLDIERFQDQQAAAPLAA